MAAVGKVKKKVLPAPGLRFDPDPPAMPLDDPLANGQADPGARVFLPGVKTLEYQEYPIPVGGFNTDPVVADGEPPLRRRRRWAETWISGAAWPRNLIALAMRFWKSWAICALVGQHHAAGDRG